MIRDILRMGDPRLLERSREVAVVPSPALTELLADMRDTMRAADGAGLAAPQIGVPLRVVIFGIEQQPALSRGGAGALHRARQPGADAARAGHGGRLGGLPVGARAFAAWCRATRACATRV